MPLQNACGPCQPRGQNVPIRIRHIAARLEREPATTRRGDFRHQACRKLLDRIGGRGIKHPIKFLFPARYPAGCPRLLACPIALRQGKFVTFLPMPDPALLLPDRRPEPGPQIGNRNPAGFGPGPGIAACPRTSTCSKTADRLLRHPAKCRHPLVCSRRPGITRPGLTRPGRIPTGSTLRSIGEPPIRRRTLRCRPHLPRRADRSGFAVLPFCHRLIPQKIFAARRTVDPVRKQPAKPRTDQTGPAIASPLQCLGPRPSCRFCRTFPVIDGCRVCGRAGGNWWWRCWFWCRKQTAHNAPLPPSVPAPNGAKQNTPKRGPKKNKQPQTGAKKTNALKRAGNKNARNAIKRCGRNCGVDFSLMAQEKEQIKNIFQKKTLSHDNPLFLRV